MNWPSIAQAFGERILNAAEAPGVPSWVLPVVIAAITGFFALAVAFVGVIAAWAGRRAGNKTAEAAVQNAWTEAARQQDEHWARYLDAHQRDNNDLRKQILANTRRIDESDLRAEAAELRATQAEQLLSLYKAYLRRVVRYLKDNLPGEDWPPPPPELNLDL